MFLRTPHPHCLKKGPGGINPRPYACFLNFKVDLSRKSRLVIGVHVVDLSGHKLYVIIMKLVLARIILTISAANGLEVMMGDIGNAYLNADTQ